MRVVWFVLMMAILSNPPSRFGFRLLLNQFECFDCNPGKRHNRYRQANLLGELNCCRREQEAMGVINCSRMLCLNQKLLHCRVFESWAATFRPIDTMLVVQSLLMVNSRREKSVRDRNRRLLSKIVAWVLKGALKTHRTGRSGAFLATRLLKED